MKHRKFVKQLMALGVSRNAANAMATAVHLNSWTYAEAYKAWRPWIHLAYSARKASTAMVNMGMAIKEATQTLIDGLNRYENV